MPILLQKSENAGSQISRQKTKQATIADRWSASWKWRIRFGDKAARTRYLGLQLLQREREVAVAIAGRESPRETQKSYWVSVSPSASATVNWLVPAKVWPFVAITALLFPGRSPRFRLIQRRSGGDQVSNTNLGRFVGFRRCGGERMRSR